MYQLIDAIDVSQSISDRDCPESNASLFKYLLRHRSGHEVVAIEYGTTSGLHLKKRGHAFDISESCRIIMNMLVMREGDILDPNELDRKDTVYGMISFAKSSETGGFVVILEDGVMAETFQSRMRLSVGVTGFFIVERRGGNRSIAGYSY